MSKKKTDKTIGLERGARFLEAVKKLDLDETTVKDLVQVMFKLPIYEIRQVEMPKEDFEALLNSLSPPRHTGSRE